MKDFFRNIKINFEEYIEKLKMTDKKSIIKTVICIIVAIAIGVGIYFIVKDRQNIAYSADKTANAYINEYTSFNYYDAYDYTILGKKGVDNYIESNYLNELKSGENTSQEAISAINSLSIAYTTALYSKINQTGFNDCDTLFSWYFTNAITDTNNTIGEEYATKKILLNSFKQSVEIYKNQVDENLKDEYIGYDLKTELTSQTDFNNDEVKLYIENKSDKAKKTFENADLSVSKIKEVKRYDYNIIINSETKRTMSVYLVKLGSKWYVDNTALI